MEFKWICSKVIFFILIYNCLVIGLIVLFFLSFTLFIRRLLQSSAAKKTTCYQYESEAGRIIELLEINKK